MLKQHFNRMRILIIGAGGMLGHKTAEKLSADFSVWTTVKGGLDGYKNFKIFDPKKTFENVNVQRVKQIREIIIKVKPDVTINAVGIIKQLPALNNVVQTLNVNSIFPHVLAELTDEFASRLITFSTDCVFRGDRGNYTEEDAPDALDLYGRSKNFGEIYGGDCLTLRTSIIGRELLTKHSLVEWFLSNRGKKVKGFKNAVFSGFPTVVTAEIIADLITNHKNLKGLYHLSAEPISKFDLLGLLKKAYKTDVEIEPDENFVIDRSLDSAKFRMATNFKPKNWDEMVEEMARDNSLYES